MRWLMGITAIAVVLLGGVAGVGLLLPPAAVFTQSIETPRPVSTVYALTANLRSFPLFAPWLTIDPDTVYEIEGAPGAVGQTLRWRSDHPLVGTGTIRIAEADPGRRIVLDVDAGAGGLGRSTFAIEPLGVGAQFTWTAEFRCPDEPLAAIPCRWRNLIMGGEVHEDQRRGLEQIARLARELPGVDFADLDAEIVTAQPRTFVYVEGESARNPDQIREAVRRSLGLVRAFLETSGGWAAGPAVTLALPGEGERVFRFRAGFPFEGPAPVGTLQVRVGETPSGPAVRAVHEGPYSTLDATYEQLDAYMQAHRLTVMGGPWEVYIDNPDDGGAARTEIWYLVE